MPKRRLAFSAEHGLSGPAKRHLGWGQAAVAIAVLGMLGAFLLNRIELYQELAEKSAMETTVMNLRTGLRFRIVEMLMHHDEGKIPALVGGNPVRFLETPLPNFAGELGASDVGRVMPGHWYFDLTSQELRYRPMRTRNFIPKRGLPAEVRFGLVPESSRMGAANRATGIRGVTLMVLEPYQWF